MNLKFTVSIFLYFTWTKEENYPNPAKEERSQIVTNNGFPFLDMKMS